MVGLISGATAVVLAISAVLPTRALAAVTSHASTLATATFSATTSAHLDGTFTATGTYTRTADCPEIDLLYSAPDATNGSTTISSAMSGSTPATGTFSIDVTDKQHAVGMVITLTVQAVCTDLSTPTLATTIITVAARTTTEPLNAVYPSASNTARLLKAATITATATTVTYRLSRGTKTIANVVSPGTRHALSYSLSRTYTPTGTYSLTTTVANAPELTTNKTFVVNWGWAPLETRGDVAAYYGRAAPTDSATPVAYARCSSLTYSVSTAGKPASVNEALLERDIAQAFSIMARSTGLHFHRTTAADPTITVTWAKLPAGVSGRGGSSYYADARYFKGTLQLSTTDWWPRKPGFNDAKAGRGSLLLHEIGHIVGLAHVEEHTYVMTPTHFFGVTAATFTSDELRGLQSMYAPTTCGDYDDADEPSAAKVPASPGPVENEHVTLTSTGATITWTPPVDGPVRGYDLYQLNGSTNSPTAKLIARLGSTVHHAHVARPAHAQSNLRYMVVAYGANTEIESPWPDDPVTVDHR